LCGIDSLLDFKPHPDLETIKTILAKAVKYKSNGAKYLEILLEVLASGGFYEDKVFLAFYDLFLHRQLADCKNTNMNPYGLHFAQEGLNLRFMPFGLEYKFACSSTIACKGSQRFRNTTSLLPGEDEDYPLTNFYLYYRLDIEIAWFFEQFRFIDLDILL